MNRKSKIQDIKDRHEEINLTLDIMDTIEKHPTLKIKSILIVLNDLMLKIISKNLK